MGWKEGQNRDSLECNCIDWILLGYKYMALVNIGQDQSQIQSYSEKIID